MPETVEPYHAGPEPDQIEKLNQQLRDAVLLAMKRCKQLYNLTNPPVSEIYYRIAVKATEALREIDACIAIPDPPPRP